MAAPGPVSGLRLVADIGATHARFSLAGSDGLRGDMLRLPTASFATVRQLLQQAVADLRAAAVESACLAVAGPVSGGQARLTNGTLAFHAADAEACLGCPVRLVNDFFALARSLPDLEALDQLGGSGDQPGVKAVLGPGSGLGMGMLIPEARGWRVLASEGGHADLAPGSPLEAEILAVLQARHGHVSWETVLSGRGLVRLYQAVCAVWGAEPQDVNAEWISARGVTAEQPVCHQTLELFFAFLGAAAGNLAVTACASGGVYVGGGIVPQLVEFAGASPLRRRFEERGVMAEFVRDIPLYLILDPAPGLLGAWRLSP